jgi:ATP-citrate lyase beta-subunit
MAQRAIREYEGKRIISQNWEQYFSGLQSIFTAASVANGEELASLAGTPGYGWLGTAPLVVKPDMIFGKRGKNGLVYFCNNEPGDVRLQDAVAWIEDRRASRTTLLSGQNGVLSRFLVEPFVPHAGDREYYLSAVTTDEADILSFSTAGGVDVESNWGRVTRVVIPAVCTKDELTDCVSAVLHPLPAPSGELRQFVTGFYRLFRDLHFGYLEFNPFVLEGDHVHLLDLVAKVDDTAGYLMQKHWGPLYFPTPFGMKAPGPEEKAIRALDEKSGASLKLTVLNPDARVWTLVAGGGASVVYADTIADLIGVEDLANYGEYSGNPTAEETCAYTRTILDLMTLSRAPKGRGKILLIGGAIANFTDVAKTFTGVISAFHEYAERMRECDVRVFVRRGGPNYELGLRRIRQAAIELGIPIEVFGPETHMTDIVQLSLQPPASSQSEPEPQHARRTA